MVDHWYIGLDQWVINSIGPLEHVGGPPKHVSGPLEHGGGPPESFA